MSRGPSPCPRWSSPSALSSGLWPDGSDGTDVNAVCRSHDKSLLVTGDDFGKVHLFSYPCSQSRVPHRTLNTHPANQIPLWLGRWSTFVSCVFFIIITPGSEPSLQRPQQSCDQRELPAGRQLPGVGRGEGHERDAVEDSVRRAGTGDSDRVGLRNPMPEEAKLHQN